MISARNAFGLSILPLFLVYDENLAMPPALHHLATGIHASVYAYQVLRLAHDRSFAEEKIDPTLSPQVAFNQGLEGWRALKIVRAGASGKMRDLKPHNVLREVLILQKALHPNVSIAWNIHLPISR